MGPENEVYFMECFPREGTISLRPKGARDGEAVVRVSAGQVYRWAMKARADATKRRKTVRRGTLDFQRRRDA
jgi:hypothetical protein